MKRLTVLITHPWFERLVLVVIIANAITLGLETYPQVMAVYGDQLMALDSFFLVFFVVELLLRITAFGRGFFRDGWNWFDASVVLLTLLPLIGVAGLGNVSAFRAVRLLRVLSAIPSFRSVLRGIGRALAGSMAVMAVLGVILYVYSVISVKLFRDVSPDRFADLDSAFFTFFQIMTLDAWSDIVRPLMEAHWWAGIFFGSFIVTAVFILLSIIIGVASNAMNFVEDDAKERHAREEDT